MKINFKNIIIIFLVALLGGGIGTYGVMNIYKQNNKRMFDQPAQISSVQYGEKKETNFTKAIDIAYNCVVEIKSTVESNYSSSFFFFEPMPAYSTSMGSGVIISQDGYIVTNEHVIDGANQKDAVKVKLYDGSEYIAQIIGYDTRTDLAVLKIDAEKLPFVSIADSSQLSMGEDVIAIGNPLGLGISCSNGIISALEKEIYINNVYLTVLQTNAAVNEGNSGGGLFDLNGNLVGIVNAKKSSNTSSTTVEGMGYAIPSNTVKKIINELIENGYVKDRAALGIKVYTGTSYYSTNGVVVSEVIDGGSAQQAGILVGDTIVSINDIKVSEYADLSKVLDSKFVGDVVVVKVLRNDEYKEFKVTLQQSVAN